MQLSTDFTTAEAGQAGMHPMLRDAHSVLNLLDGWQAAGWLRLIDVHFARFLHDQRPDVSGLLVLAAALASHQMGRGHVCLDLAATLNGPGQVLSLPPEFRAMTRDQTPPPTPAELLGSLSLSGWEAAMDPALVSDGSVVAPLVYQHGRLYLYRYWRYEQQVADGIALRLQRQGETPEPEPALLKTTLDALFGASPAGAPLDWQRLACALAARQRFAVITGGPGTGKTTTVLRLLALLQSLHFQQLSAGEASAAEAWQPLRIRLAAPTGKAAARLSESIAGRLAALSLASLPGGDRLAEAIPTQVVTLHRLLGGRPHVRQRTYHADHPLPLDVLVVDEASMVSLSDMADLIEAMPANARLVLIGDKDQLSSVEAGAVLGALCGRAAAGHYLPATAEWLAEATGMVVPPNMVDAQGQPLDQAVAMLRTSHRFDHDSGIGQLANAINAGDAPTAIRLLDSSGDDLAQIHAEDPQSAALASLILHGSASRAGPVPGTGIPRHGYGHYLAMAAQPPADSDPRTWDNWAAAVLHAHRSAQLLCVVRNGPWGVEGLNLSIARLLYERGLIPAHSGWYTGRPVMVTRNNRALRLNNGDIGLVLPGPHGAGQAPVLRVAFPEGDGVRWIAPNRLDDIETVYALTVHKSQGSEFHHAVLVLPDTPGPVLTRELLYTGITRASHWFTLVNPGGQGLLRQAIGQRVYRSGGLGDLLAAMGGG